MTGAAHAHDILDAMCLLPRVRFAGTVWRVAREKDDPAAGGKSRSRWCDMTFDVLYAAMSREAAIQETYAVLAAQPVFPAARYLCYELAVTTTNSLEFASSTDFKALARAAGGPDGGEASAEAIASAAYFLGFDGLIAPNPRWKCQDVVLFTERLAPAQIQLTGTAPKAIDWQAWRKHKRLAPRTRAR
jgi:RES domain-containing protein